MIRRKYKAVVSAVLTVALAAGMVVSADGTAVQAKAKAVALSAKSIQVTVGGTKTIKVKNTKKSVKWSVKSGKKYISLTKKKKTSVSVKGKKAGNAVVLAKVNGKKLTCKVKVNKAKAPKPTPTETTPAATESPAVPDTPSATQPAESNNPIVPTGVPVPTEVPSAGEEVKDITIDLTKCGDTTFTTSPAKIDFSSQIDSRFDLKLFKSMVVGYELDFDGDAPSGYAGKIGLASTQDTLTGYLDGVAFTYNMMPGSSSVEVDLSADTIEGTVVGINVQPMDGDAGYAWPANLKSVTITSITFTAVPGAVYSAPGVTPASTPVPGPTYAPEPFTYEGLDTSWIDPEKPMVAFTFDDGPVGNKDDSTSMIIQSALKKYNAHATFFYIGSKINTSEMEDEIKQAVANGFEVGNHSWKYDSMKALKEDAIKDSIEKTNDKLSELTGYSNFLFRAPNLEISPAMKGYIKAPFINAATDSQDWNKATTEKIIENVKKAKDGDIVLMHETEKNTAEAIEELLKYFTDEGWQVVSVSELFAVRNQELTTGKVYTSCPR